VMEDAREARGAMTIGPAREKAFLERFRASQEGMAENERGLMNSDFASRIKPLLVDGKIGTSPETLLPTLEAWIGEFETGNSEQTPAPPDPAPEPPPAKIEAPTPDIIRQTLRSIETHRPGASAEIFQKTGIPETGDWNPDQAQEIWEAAQPYLKEAIEGE